MIGENAGIGESCECIHALRNESWDRADMEKVMKMQSMVKAVSLGFAVMVLSTAGVARADQLDAAEAGNPNSVLNKDQPSSGKAVSNEQVEAAEAGEPHSTLNNGQPVPAATDEGFYQAQLGAAEAGNPHSIDNARQ
jgi:hypothetical protein